MSKRLISLSSAAALTAAGILSLGLILVPFASNAQCSLKTASKTNINATVTAKTSSATAEEIVDGLFPETSVASIRDQYLTATGGIYMAADNEIVLNKPSRSDVAVAGNNVTINRNIGADLFAAGNTVSVNGDIAGAARIGARVISINGTVTGNTFIFANEVTIAENAILKGNVNIYANKIIIEGSIKQSAHLGANEIIINGELKNIVEIDGGTVSFGPEAIVTKDIIVTSPFSVDLNPNATGTERISYIVPETTTKSGSTTNTKYARKLSRWLISFFSFGILGVLLIIIWPKWAKQVADVMLKKPADVWQRGLLFFFVAPSIALLIAFTVIGIPISFILLFCYTMLLFLGRLFAGIAFGHLLINHNRCKDPQKQYILFFVAGYFVLSVLMSLSWIGWIICSLACIWGVGGLLHVAQQSRKTRKKKK